MDSQMAQNTQSLTTAEDSRETMRNQTKLIMQPYANWEQYLTPAPLSIAIMGELVFISSKTDFSTNKNPPKDGYKYIRYQDSFRACLMQVCNSGWGAFNEAHKNMDQIHLYTMKILNHIQTAVKILFQRNDEVVQAHLPHQLENIRGIADDCLALAQSTENKMCNASITISETYMDIKGNAPSAGELDKINIYSKSTEILIWAQMIQQHVHNDTINWNILYDPKTKTTHTDVMKKEFIRINSRLEGIPECKPKKQVREICEEAIDVCDELAIYAPEGKCEEAETKQLIKKIRKLTESAQAFDSKRASEKASENSRFHVEQSQTQLKETRERCGKSVENMEKNQKKLTEILMTMRNCVVKETGINTNKDIKGNVSSADELDKINIYSKSTEILIWAQMIQQYVHNDTINWNILYDPMTKTTHTDVMKKEFIRINSRLEGIPECKPKKQVREICEEAIDVCDELAIYAPEGKCEEAKTKQLIKKIRKLTESAQAFDSMSKDVTKSEKKSASEKASENARGSYEKRVENMEKNQKEVTENKKCEVKEMLVKGMDAMGRMRGKWEKMVRFFQMVSNIIKTSLMRTLKDFVITSEKIQSLSYNSKLFSKDLLYNQAFEASNIASLVHMISATYTDVSEKYLMDRVSSLGKLMAMDKEKPEFLHEREQLQISCDEAQRGILCLVLKNKAEFEGKTNARLEKIDTELLAILP